MRNGETWTEETYRQAEEALGYAFSDRSLLLTAFTHASYSNVSGEPVYDRLEFLGDALVDFVASDMLYHAHAGAEEGELTELRKQYVSKEALTPVAERMGLLRFVRSAGGAGNLGKKVPSDLFEAVAAAIYLDGGMDAARAFLEAHLAFTEIVDYKTTLQQYAQKHHRQDALPHYETQGSAEEGFVSTVTALGKSAQGRGNSKKEAETAAAKELYTVLKKR